MNNRKIIKGYKTLISSRFKVYTSIDKFKDGIIYTLYSDEFNSLKVGFAENDKVLEKKLSSEALILLDMKKGKKKDLCLLITTLKELGIKYYLSYESLGCSRRKRSFECCFSVFRNWYKGNEKQRFYTFSSSK